MFTTKLMRRPRIIRERSVGRLSIDTRTRIGWPAFHVDVQTVETLDHRTGLRYDRTRDVDFRAALPGGVHVGASAAWRYWPDRDEHGWLQ